MVHIFIPLMSFEITRVKARQADPHFLTYFCQRRIMKWDTTRESQGHERRASKDATSGQNYTGGFERRIINFLRENYATCLAKPLVNIPISVVAIACLVTAMIFISNKSVGYASHELFANDDPTNRAMEWIFKKFSLFPSFLCFRDLDVPGNQRNMLELYKTLLDDSTYVLQDALPTYLSMLYFMKFLGSPAADPNSNVTLQDVGFDTSWTEPTLAPFGTLTSDPQVFYNEIFHPWRQLPSDPAQAWVVDQGFVYADLVYINQWRKSMIMDDGIEKLSFSFFPFYLTSMYTEDIFVLAIQDTNKIIENSNLNPMGDNAFIYGPITAFWGIFLEIDRYVYILMAIDTVVIFLVTLVISSFDFITAIITSLSCSMIAIETFGLSCAFMNFNVFVAAISLMGMGLSVEFTAHFAMAFSLATGTIVERLGTAMAHTFLALMEGSLSTFCSLLPLAFSQTMFEVKYLFGITSMVVLVGFINGVFVMPALLAALDPIITWIQKRTHTAKDGGNAADSHDAKLPRILDGEKKTGEMKASEVNI